MKNEKFQMTKKELADFEKSFQNQEFRNLFFDYLKEIEDPKNKQLYEEEIIKLEKEQGNSVKFVNPKAWKAYLVTGGGEELVINICEGQVENFSSKGGELKIPFALNPVRDGEFEGRTMQVYTIAFHPDAIKLLDVFETALDEIGKIRKQKLKLVRELGNTIVGRVENTIIREGGKDTKNDGTKRGPYSIIKKMVPQAREPTNAAVKSEPRKKQQTADTPVIDIKTGMEIPRYTITYLQIVDGYQPYTGDRFRLNNSQQNTHIKLDIHLPRIIKPSMAGELDVEIDKHGFELKGCGYWLKLDFKEELEEDEEKMEAKFDAATKKLIIKVPLIAKAVDVAPLVSVSPVSEVLDEVMDKDDVEVNLNQVLVSDETSTPAPATIEDAGVPAETQATDLVDNPTTDTTTLVALDMNANPVPTKTVELISDKANDPDERLVKIQKDDTIADNLEKNDESEEKGEPQEVLGLASELIQQNELELIERKINELIINEPNLSIEYPNPELKTFQTLQTATIIIDTPGITKDSVLSTTRSPVTVAYQSGPDIIHKLELEMEEHFDYRIDIGPSSICLIFTKKVFKYWETFKINKRTFGFMNPQASNQQEQTKGNVESQTRQPDKVDVDAKVTTSRPPPQQTVLVNDLLFQLD